MSEENPMSTVATPAPPADVAAPPAPSRGRRLARLLAEQPLIGLGAVFILLYAVTGAVDGSLFTPNGVRSVLLLAAPLGILAAAQTLTLLTGGIDLSVALTANFAAYVAATQSGEGTVRALLLAFAVGLVVGMINGIGVGVFHVNPLIMTLGMSSVLLGVITIGITGFLSGSTRLPEIVTTVGSGTLVGPIPMNAVVWAVVAFVLIFGLSRTGIGRTIYGVGDNRLAVRLAGVRVWQVLLVVYTVAGVLAALAGLLFAGIAGSVGPDAVNSFLLLSVAAAVIGGTSIFGGRGGYAGTIVGALILTVLDRLLRQLDTTEAFRQILYGLVVLALAWVYVRLTGQKES